jgi:hypothetical protein
MHLSSTPFCHGQKIAHDASEQTKIKVLKLIQHKSRLSQLHEDRDVVRMQGNAALANIACTREKVGGEVSQSNASASSCKTGVGGIEKRRSS